MEIKDVCESLETALSFSSRDWSMNKRDAWIYGIVCGWDNASYEELQDKFGWSDESIERNKQLHTAFKVALGKGSEL